MTELEIQRTLINKLLISKEDHYDKFGCKLQYYRILNCYVSIDFSNGDKDYHSYTVVMQNLLKDDKIRKVFQTVEILKLIQNSSVKLYRVSGIPLQIPISYYLL